MTALPILRTIWRAFFPLWAWAAFAGMLWGLRCYILGQRTTFGLEALLGSDPSAWGLLLLISTASIVLYLLSEALLRAFRETTPRLYTKLLLFGLSALSAFSPGLARALGVEAPTLALLAFSYLLLFDLFLDYRSNSLTWTVVWTLFFAGIATAFTHAFQLEKEAVLLRSSAQEAARRQRVPSDDLGSTRVYRQILASPVGRISSSPLRLVLRQSGQDVQSFGEGPGIPWKRLEQVLQRNDQGEYSGMYNGRIAYYALLPSGVRVYADRPLPGYPQLLPNFALFFISILLLSAMLAWAYTRWRWPAPAIYLPFNWNVQFRGRVQRMALGIAIGTFSLFILIAIPFFRQYSIQDAESRIIRQASRARGELSRQPVVASSRAADSLLHQIARQLDLDLDLYDAKGYLLASSERNIYQANLRPARLPDALVKQLNPGKAPYILQTEHIQDVPVEVLYLPLSQAPLSGATFVGIPFQHPSEQLSEGLKNFLGAMLMVSIFLLLLSVSAAIWIANQLTEPLANISENLRSFRIGENRPLSWENEGDEIGELVRAYNAAIEQVEASARQLRQSEREKAWREMARQVAHEIKNPLTPMKLSIQYLLHAYQRDPERIGTLLPDAAATLSEQMDGLARIATEFSNFAQMPQAENQPVALSEALMVSVELFRQGQDTLHVELPAAEVWVFADRRLLVRVFNNLIQNAFQAIPPDRTPDIQVRLDTVGHSARIRFRDNGTGIPEAIQESVFYPNFTTKSSGMGLGLAICRNIILQAGGGIYFQTIENQGTDFIIELPLYQV